MSNRIWWQIVAAVFVAFCLAYAAHYVFIHIVTVLTLFAAGLLVAWVMDPLLDRLEAHGWPRGAAVWTVTAGFLVVIAVAGILLVPLIVFQVQDAAAHWKEYSTTAQNTYQAWRQGVEQYVTVKYPGMDIMPFVDTKVNEGTTWLSNHIPAFLTWLSQKLIASIGLVALGAMLLIISFHFMNIIDPLRKSIKQMLPQSADREMEKIDVQINAMLGQYLRGIVLVSVLVGISAAIALSIVSLFFGTKYGLILGVVTGVTYMIPYFGPLISAISAGFFGYVTASVGSPWVAAAVSIAAMYAINQAFDVVLTPRIVGQRVGLHPLVILFAVFVGLSLFGIPGMIIATPAAASIKIILAQWLPIKSVDFTAPCQKRRLELDLPAAMGVLSHNLSRLSKDVEHVMKLEQLTHRHREQVSEPEKEPTQAPAPASAEPHNEKDVSADNAKDPTD